MRRFGLLLFLRSGALVCLAAAPTLAGELSGTVRVSGRPAQHAVVWLEGPGLPPAPQKKVVLDQRNLAFVPFVLAVRVGTTVEFPNNDKVFHNVFSFRDGKKFDLGMYPTGSMKPLVFDQPGLARLFCNIHPNMAAYVLAVDSPYFAVSNEKGAFTLVGVPPGTYTYHAWRPGGQPLTGSIKVDGNTPLEISWP
jgi:plastocyanin